MNREKRRPPPGTLQVTPEARLISWSRSLAYRPLTPFSRRLLFCAAVLGCAMGTSSASAERDLSRHQGTEWLGQQYALLGGLTLANVSAMTLGKLPLSARTDVVYFADAGEEANLSPYASPLSDVSLLTAVLAPVGTLSTRGATAWGNALLIYAESLEISLLANTLAKRTVLRARPYTHGPGGAERAREAGADAYFSFYSGHSALSFTAATASSVLFSSLSQDGKLRSAHYAGSFALAAFTAQARVRAGRHYPTDVAVGSLLGIIVGLAVPAANEIALRLAPAEVAAAFGGAAVGFASALLLPRNAWTESVAWPDVDFLPGGAVVHWDLGPAWKQF